MLSASPIFVFEDEMHNDSKIKHEFVMHNECIELEHYKVLMWVLGLNLSTLIVYICPKTIDISL